MSKSVFPSGTRLPKEFVIITTSGNRGDDATLCGYQYINGLYAGVVEKPANPYTYFGWVTVQYVPQYYTITAARDLTAVLPDGTKKIFKAGEIMISDWHYTNLKTLIVY